MNRSLLHALLPVVVAISACTTSPDPDDAPERTFRIEPVQENLLAAGTATEAAAAENTLALEPDRAADTRGADRDPAAREQALSLTLVTDADNDPRVAERFLAVSLDYPVIITSHRTSLPAAPRDCPPLDLTADCLRDLAGELGTHGLLVAAADRQDPRRITIRHYDLRIPEAYPARRYTLAMDAAGIATGAIDQLADTVLLEVTDRGRALPWTVPISGHLNGAWRLGLTEAEGLTAGDGLVVLRDGRVLRSMTGEPISWLPGRAVGRLQIDAFDDDGRAIATLDAGEPPRAGDLLLPAP